MNDFFAWNKDSLKYQKLLNFMSELYGMNISYLTETNVNCSGHWTLIDKNCISVLDLVSISKAVYQYILKNLSFGSENLI